MMKNIPEVGLARRFEAGMSRSDFASVLVSVPRGRRSSLKLRFAESTGVPTRNGFAPPLSGLMALSLATENGCNWLL